MEVLKNRMTSERRQQQTEHPSQLRYFILTGKDLIASRSGSKGSVGDEQVLKGSLWHSTEEGHSKHHKKIVLISAEFSEVDPLELKCSVTDVDHIEKDVFHLLIAITTCSDRLIVFENPKWVQEALVIEASTVVYVFKTHGIPDRTPAVVRYKGPLPGSKGTWFGVELLVHRGKGTTDGVYRKQRLFYCPLDCGLFIPINKIRLCKDKVEIVNYDQIGPRVYAPPPLKLDDRVVWMSDEGPEYGTVKWIGILEDSQEREYTVGVEFDNPIGTGTGKYNNKQLFRTRPNHASLIPVLGLMKASEFEGSNGGAPPDIHVTYLGGYNSKRVSKTPFPKAPHLASRRPPEHYAVSNEQFISQQKGILEQLQGKHRTQISVDVHKEKALNESDGIFNKGSAAEGVDILTKNVCYPPDGLEQSDNARHTIGIVQEQTPAKLRQHSPSLPTPQSLKFEVAKRKSSSLPKDTQEWKDLEVGSMVEVLGNPPKYGLLRWIGNIDSKEPQKLIAGLEMDEEGPACTDGTFGKTRYFTCPAKKGFFVYLHKCRKDRRFEENPRLADRSLSQAFGSEECPDVEGLIPPPATEPLESFLGKQKGIQGHHNSCYLDATLFSIFAFAQPFDTLLFRKRNENDIPEYNQVQQVLLTSIVNPLRKNFYVRADKVMKLRSLLDRLGSTKGLMSEEKDPEEFLNCLLQHVMKADPFIRLSSGQVSFYYQLFIEKDERLLLPTTQQLFELSFLQSNIKLAEIPSCFILQMPRFGKNYKMYKRIIPSLYLDITDVLENSPRECTVCGELALFECKDCYEHFGASLSKIAFCNGCKDTVHKNRKRSGHKPQPLSLPNEYFEHIETLKNEGHNAPPIQRELLELFAVVCIETSHYVSFVKTGTGPDAKWLFFDSMADRIGAESGYNIPEVKLCPDIPELLDTSITSTIGNIKDDRNLPEYQRRLVCDAYMCMYQSKDYMMYK